VLQAEPLPDRFDVDYGIVARTFFNHFHIPFKHQVCEECQQVEQLIKLLKTTDAEIRREAEQSEFEKAAQVAEGTINEEFRKGWIEFPVAGPRSEIVAKYTARAIRALGGGKQEKPSGVAKEKGDEN
jgi:hypothetical protein